MSLIDLATQVRLGDNFKLAKEGGGTGRSDGRSNGVIVECYATEALARGDVVAIDLTDTSMGGSPRVYATTTSGEAVFGVVVTGAAIRFICKVIVLGSVSRVTLGGTVTAGQYLYASSSGTALGSTTVPDGVFGVALGGGVSTDQVTAYIEGSVYAEAGIYQALAERGVADGYAGLDSSGLVPIAQLPLATPAVVLGTAAAAGSATTLIRSDSTIVAFDATAPVTQAFGDVAATGSVAAAARRDHVHGMPAPSGVTGSTFAIVAVFDGGGSAITGNPEVDVILPANGTLVSATLLADATGSAVVDIWGDTYASYPPTVADTITASAKPTLAGAAKTQDTSLTGWTTALVAGRSLRFHVDSVATITRLQVVLLYTRS